MRGKESFLALTLALLDSSPKGGALGKTRNFVVTAKASPSGEVALRSNDGEGEDAKGVKAMQKYLEAGKVVTTTVCAAR